MGMRVGHEAFQTGPGAYRHCDNFVTRIVHFFRIMQLAITVVIKWLVRPNVYHPKCRHQQFGLIGKEMFAIDGCKLPSNTSNTCSVTHKEFEKKCQKIDRAARRILQRHHKQDLAESESTLYEREQEQIRRLCAASQKSKSNITDNDCAKMKSDHGVILGHTGVGAVASKHQVVVHAEALGQGQVHGLLKPGHKVYMRPSVRATRQLSKHSKSARITA